MKLMNLGNYSKYNAIRLVTELSRLDAALTAETTITLCGSASVLLQGVDFRETADVDFCKLPSSELLALIAAVYKGRTLFDVNAAGIIGLLIDYEDRLVTVDLGFQFLHVYCLCTRDWIVSKLASPKLDDVWERRDITLEDLLWVQEHMYDYGGISIDRANNDLAHLIRVFKERGV